MNGGCGGGEGVGEVGIGGIALDVAAKARAEAVPWTKRRALFWASLPACKRVRQFILDARHVPLHTT